MRCNRCNGYMGFAGIDAPEDVFEEVWECDECGEIEFHPVGTSKFVVEQMKIQRENGKKS